MSGKKLANRLRRLLPALLLSLLLCTGCEAGQRNLPQTWTQGAKKMITYPVGRFAIDIPAEMKLDHQGQTFRYAEVEEVVWPSNVPREQAREAEWQKRLSEIVKLEPPKGKDEVVVETRDIPGIGTWARGVLYRGNRLSLKDGRWLVLMDVGQVGVFLELDGLIQYETDMLHDLIAIATSYKTRRFGDVKLLVGNWFYTQHGAINLPYLEQESSYARFEGHPLGVIIEVETTEVHQVEVEGHGLLGRLAAVAITGYSAGVEVKKIRTGKRTVAGLPGEELVLRLKAAGDKELSFMWRYSGKQDSGEQPLILVEMESEDGQVDAKLKVWDAMLDSIKPLYK